MADILKSFLEQTYGSLEKAREADRLADLNPNCYTNQAEEIGDPKLEKMANDEAQKQAMKGHFENTPIKSSMYIPSKLNDGEIDQKIQQHQLFKGYKHQLEMSRSQKLGLIRLKEIPTGDVESLYDNMFNDDSNLIE